MSEPLFSTLKRVIFSQHESHVSGTVGNSNPIPNPGVNKFEAKSKSTVFLSDPNPNPADRYLDPDPNMDLANNQQMNDALVFI